MTDVQSSVAFLLTMRADDKRRYTSKLGRILARLPAADAGRIVLAEMKRQHASGRTDVALLDNLLWNAFVYLCNDDTTTILAALQHVQRNEDRQTSPYLIPNAKLWLLLQRGV